MNAVVCSMSQWCWGLWRSQGENRKFLHHQGPPGGERTFSSRSNYKQILMPSLFCRKPSSSIPKMPPPFIFWATGESIYCSIHVSKAENRINNILSEIVPCIPPTPNKEVCNLSNSLPAACWVFLGCLCLSGVSLLLSYRGTNERWLPSFFHPHLLPPMRRWGLNFSCWCFSIPPPDSEIEWPSCHI